MSRSIKKGPFADEHLLKKVDELNEKNEKKELKLGLVAQLFSLNLFHIQLLFMTAENMCQFILLKTW